MSKVVSFENAKALKSIGYNEPCYAKYTDSGELKIGEVYYNSDLENEYCAPSFSDVVMWFDNKNFTVGVMRESAYGLPPRYEWVTNYDYNGIYSQSSAFVKTMEEGYNAAIEWATNTVLEFYTK